jgi:hypothetical protein
MTIEAAVALPAARTPASATGSSITLVRVDAKTIGDLDESQRARRRAEDEMRATTVEIAAGRLAVDWLIATGPVGSSMVEAARVSRADLSLVATHARTDPAGASAETGSSGRRRNWRYSIDFQPGTWSEQALMSRPVGSGRR